MAGINLAPIAKVVSNLVLLDTVRITEPGTGTPVFDAATGEYTYPDPLVVYEGPGAVQFAGTPGGISSIPVANLPWSDETRSRYQLLTPLDAPVPQRDHIVSVVQVHAGGDTELIGRQWRCQDPGEAATLSVVRITSLDQVQQAQEGSG